MSAALRLCEDILSDGAALALAPSARFIFVVHGAVTIADRTLGDGEAWHGEGAATLVAGKAGATCWRFELMSGAPADATAIGVSTREKLAAVLETLPQGD